MKITIISAYTWFNKGDSAILMGTLTELNEVYKNKYNLEYNILTFTPDIYRENYKVLFENISLVESNMFNPYPVKKTTIRKGIAAAKMGMQYLNLKFRTIKYSTLPQSNVLKFIFKDSSWIAIRPSGTEPKIKFYLGVTSKNKVGMDNKMNELQKFLEKYI